MLSNTFFKYTKKQNKKMVSTTAIATHQYAIQKIVFRKER